MQVWATLPNNFIAFEYPVGQPAWWYEMVEPSKGGDDHTEGSNWQALQIEL